MARWIAQDQDNEPYIFRKFDELSARNLLHLQSEVLELERNLKELDEEWESDDELGPALLS